MIPSEAVDRFLRYVLKRGVEECWLWSGANIDGYGVLAINKRNVKATHISLWLWKGEVKPTPKHEACHTCDNPACCNPKHLWWGTRTENARDARDKGRLNFGPEVRAKMSAAGKGRPKSEDHKRKIGEKQRGALNHRYGTKLSPEAVRKLVSARQSSNERNVRHFAFGATV